MKYKEFVFLLICNLLWAGNFIFGKFVIQEFSPLWITFLRWMIAVSILFPVAVVHDNLNYAKMRSILKESWPALTCMGISGGILFNVFTYSALQYTSPTNGSLVFSLTPAITMIFSYLIWKEKVSIMQMAGLSISFLGVVVLLTSGNILHVFQMDFNRGDLLMIGADLCWMIYAFSCKKSATVPPITAIAISSLIAIFIMIPFIILQPIDFHQVTRTGINGVLYIGVFASVFAFILWNMSLRIVGASKANLTVNLIPVYTAAIAIIIGEQVSATQLWGGAMVLTGLVLTSQKRKELICIRVNKQEVDLGDATIKRPHYVN
ncbi:DMT family transporter [Pelosinus sp. IPA-1]|uniref:DMT family transporter n=1 Tax=Pelosinus sp. IPA-1 TaxID=3029569 RepID=UPI0024362833|nr:DMT family transporter [Pelosinus sp. IPA-1]GMB00538.1 transporter [Pelosinus sp. IPA-1]